MKFQVQNYIEIKMMRLIYHTCLLINTWFMKKFILWKENLHLKLQKYRRDGQAKIEKGSVIANSISVKYLNLTILEVLLCLASGKCQSEVIGVRTELIWGRNCPCNLTNMPVFWKWNSCIFTSKIGRLLFEFGTFID